VRKGSNSGVRAPKRGKKGVVGKRKKVEVSDPKGGGQWRDANSTRGGQINVSPRSPTQFGKGGGEESSPSQKRGKKIFSQRGRGKGEPKKGFRRGGFRPEAEIRTKRRVTGKKGLQDEGEAKALVPVGIMTSGRD